MKQFVLIHLLIFYIYLTFSNCLIQIELKKSLAKYHSEYLMTLKLQQILKKKGSHFSSFLEEKEITLHQQVYNCL